jgi:lambda family phage portal protein
MKLIGNIFRGFVTGFQRGYNAAKKTRLLNWALKFTPINQAVKEGIEPTRERARELYKNNSYAKGIRNLSRAEIVGHNGFKLQNKAKLSNGDLDEDVNTAIEEAYEEFSKPEYFTMRGDLSRTRVEWLWNEHLDRDGEVLARIITDPNVNKFGVSLELLEPDDLDHTYNEVLPNGNVIIMGIEYNSWLQKQKFYLLKRSQNQYYNEAHYHREHEEIDAKYIIHGYDFSHSKQLRAVSDLSTIISDLQSLDAFESASLKNAEWSAKLLGFFVKKRIEGDAFDGNVDKGDPIQDLSIGDASALELPTYTEFQSPNRDYPHAMHGPFISSMLKKIASGSGHDYSAIANDRSAENYSSLRSGKLTAQRMYMIRQRLLDEIAVTPVFKHWLKWALIKKAVPGVAYEDIDRVNKPHFQPPRWAWVDPLKDVAAAKMAIACGLSTLTAELAKQGIDINDYVRTRKRELKLLADNGLALNDSGEIIMITDGAENNPDNEPAKAKNILKFNVG